MFSFRENKKPSRKCTAGAGSARKEEEPILRHQFPSQATISNINVGVICRKVKAAPGNHDLVLLIIDGLSGFFNANQSKTATVAAVQSCLRTN